MKPVVPYRVQGARLGKGLLHQAPYLKLATAEDIMDKEI